MLQYRCFLRCRDPNYWFPHSETTRSCLWCRGSCVGIGQRAGASLKSSLETWPMGWTWMDNFTKPPMEPLSFQHFPTKFGCFSTIHVTSCSKWCWQEVLVLRASELSPLKKLIVVDMLGFSAEPSDQVDVEKARIRSTQELNCNGKVGENSNNHFCIRPIGNWLQLQSDWCIRIQPWKVRHNKWGFSRVGAWGWSFTASDDQWNQKWPVCFYLFSELQHTSTIIFFGGSMILSHCQIGIGRNSGHNRLVSFSRYDQIPIISSLNRWDWLVAGAPSILIQPDTMVTTAIHSWVISPTGDVGVPWPRMGAPFRAISRCANGNQWNMLDKWWSVGWENGWENGWKC